MKAFSPRTKDILLLILAAVILVITVFRFQQRGKGTEEKPSGQAPAILVFTHSWEGRDEELYLIKNEFEEQNRGVQIVINYLPYDKLIDEFMNNRTPVNANTGSNPGNIIAADSYIIQKLLESGKIENETHNLLGFFHPLYYNTKILEAAGFNRPPKTRSEFLEQARRTTDPQNGKYGIAFAFGENNYRGIIRDIYSWIWAAGISLAPQNNHQEIISGVRTSLQRRTTPLSQTLVFISTLAKEKLLYPGASYITEEEKRQAFIDGRTAFMIGTAEDMGYLKQQMGNVLEYTSIPAPDNYTGKPVFAWGGWSLGILRGSGQKEHTHSFIEFLEGKSNRLAQDWAITENGNMGTAKDIFYSKATELYISGELMDEYKYFITTEVTGLIMDELEKLMAE